MPPARSYRVCRHRAPDGTADPAVSLRETIPRRRLLRLAGSVGSQGLVLLTDNRIFTIQPARVLATATGCGGATAINGTLNLASGAARVDHGRCFAVPAGGANALVYSGARRALHDRPRPGPARHRSPSLWRSETGRYTAPAGAAPMPAARSARRTGS